MIKDYLTIENVRNKNHAQLYVDIVKEAYGDNNAVLIGHHIVFEADGDITTENEIPAADTLLFDHDIMLAVFGNDALPLMQAMAAVPADKRDALLQDAWDKHCAMEPQAQGYVDEDRTPRKVWHKEPRLPVFDRLYGLDTEDAGVYGPATVDNW